MVESHVHSERYFDLYRKKWYSPREERAINEGFFKTRSFYSMFSGRGQKSVEGEQRFFRVLERNIKSLEAPDVENPNPELFSIYRNNPKDKRTILPTHKGDVATEFTIDQQTKKIMAEFRNQSRLMTVLNSRLTDAVTGESDWDRMNANQTAANEMTQRNWAAFKGFWMGVASKALGIGLGMLGGFIMGKVQEHFKNLEIAERRMLAEKSHQKMLEAGKNVADANEKMIQLDKLTREHSTMQNIHNEIGPEPPDPETDLKGVVMDTRNYEGMKRLHDQWAKKRDISENRLVFLENTNFEDHLSRHSLADLFLDSFNYNAHTSAVDALWTGLPILTKSGNSFSSRICGSILKYINLDEMVTKTNEEYFAKAVELATRSEKYKIIKNKIIQAKLSGSLFDTKKYTRNLEEAFKKVHEMRIKKNKYDTIYIDELK